MIKNIRSMLTMWIGDVNATKLISYLIERRHRREKQSAKFLLIERVSFLLDSFFYIDDECLWCDQWDERQENINLEDICHWRFSYSYESAWISDMFNLYLLHPSSYVADFLWLFFDIFSDNSPKISYERLNLRYNHHCGLCPW